MDLGSRLKQARLDVGLSQRQLCGDVITRNMLSQIENGSARPSMDTLEYLAVRLGKPISFFLDGTAASPNQSLMEAARDSFAVGNDALALEQLKDYQAPDPVFDAEMELLRALCCIRLAESGAEPAEDLLRQAEEAGSRTPYYTPELERRRLLCLAECGADGSAAAAALPEDDRELLLRAEAALKAGNAARSAAYLEAAERRDTARWLILRGDAAAAAGDDTLAVQCYTQAEPLAAEKVWPKLEKSYLRLEDYKMAYFYACKQR